VALNLWLSALALLRVYYLYRAVDDRFLHEGRLGPPLFNSQIGFVAYRAFMIRSFALALVLVWPRLMYDFQDTPFFFVTNNEADAASPRRLSRSARCGRGYLHVGRTDANDHTIMQAGWREMPAEYATKHVD
jgi:hypothetical protein